MKLVRGWRAPGQGIQVERVLADATSPAPGLAIEGPDLHLDDVAGPTVKRLFQREEPRRPVEGLPGRAVRRDRGCSRACRR